MRAGSVSGAVKVASAWGLDKRKAVQGCARVMGSPRPDANPGGLS